MVSPQDPGKGPPGSRELITVEQPAGTAAQQAARHEPRDPEQDDLRGDRLLFKRVLAKGGMGSILHVYDPRLQRHVALKVLHEELAQRQGELEAFVREACTTAQLDHPNIVPVYDLYVDEERAWAGFSMKMIEGESLEQRLRSLGEARLAEAEFGTLLEVLIKVCDAVSFAHSHNRLHLDLKSANVMIGSHGQVYVLDWGIAVKCVRDERGRLRASEPQAGVRGTLAYMAPEQLEANLVAVDERSDVYALGGILYELLTGHPPFAAQEDGEERPRKAEHVAIAPAPREGALSPPPALMQVALRALARDPDDRYASVDALKAEIERLRHGGGWFHLREFAAGEVVMREGELGNDAYILVEGRCQVFKGERLLRELGAGDLFGEMAILTEGRRSATVVAATPIKAWVVTRATLLRELGQHTWVGGLVRALADRFLEADNERAALRDALERRG